MFMYWFRIISLRRVLILQQIDLFSHLAEEDLVQLAQLVNEVELEAGESICRSGDYGDTLYGIIEGAVEVHRDYVTGVFVMLPKHGCAAWHDAGDGRPD